MKCCLIWHKVTRMKCCLIWYKVTGMKCCLIWYKITGVKCCLIWQKVTGMKCCLIWYKATGMKCLLPVHRNGRHTQRRLNINRHWKCCCQSHEIITADNDSTYSSRSSLVTRGRNMRHWPVTQCGWEDLRTTGQKFVLTLGIWVYRGCGGSLQMSLPVQNGSVQQNHSVQRSSTISTLHRSTIQFMTIHLQTSEKTKNGVFWDVRPCGSCKNRRSGGT
jgi:hypothetical protein